LTDKRKDETIRSMESFLTEVNRKGKDSQTEIREEKEVAGH